MLIETRVFTTSIGVAACGDQYRLDRTVSELNTLQSKLASAIWTT
jgi:hypothetical protein